MLYIFNSITKLSSFFCRIFLQNKSFLLLGLFSLNLFSYSKENKDTMSNITIIDITKLPTKEYSVNLSQFASEISYLPLENKKECLVGPGVNFYIYDSAIISCAHHQIFTFNSKNGKFLRSIGEYGKGPDGFMNSKNSYIKNGEIIITAIGWKYPLIEFSLDGRILNKLKLERYPRDMAWLDDNLYAIYYQKNSNSDSLRIQIYDSNKNKIVSTFYDSRIFKDTPRVTMFGAFFYYYGNGLFIKEYFNDTVFQVTPEKLIPMVVFKSGKYSPPFYEKDTFDFVQYHSINTILETDNLIFFRLHLKKRTYYCYFDKRTNQVMIPNCHFQINGFENDMDGFMSFYPITISNRNELIGFLEPYQIKQWFDENPEKAKKLPLRIQRFRNIKETDNPVIMIVKLKE